MCFVVAVVCCKRMAGDRTEEKPKTFDPDMSS